MWAHCAVVLLAHCACVLLSTLIKMAVFDLRLTSHNIGGCKSITNHWTQTHKDEFAAGFRNQHIIALQEIKSDVNVKRITEILDYKFASISRRASGQLCYLYRADKWTNGNFEDGPYREEFRREYTNDPEVHIVWLVSLHPATIPDVYVVNLHLPTKKAGAVAPDVNMTQVQNEILRKLSNMIQSGPPPSRRTLIRRDLIPSDAVLVVMGDFNCHKSHVWDDYLQQQFQWSESIMGTTPLSRKAGKPAIDHILVRGTPNLLDPLMPAWTPKTFLHNHLVVSMHSRLKVPLPEVRQSRLPDETERWTWSYRNHQPHLIMHIPPPLVRVLMKVALDGSVLVSTLCSASAL